MGFGASYLPDLLAYLIYTALGLLCFLTIYFFRDPDRETPKDESLIISPADGKVVLIKNVEESEYMKQPATQISIFSVAA